MLSSVGHVGHPELVELDPAGAGLLNLVSVLLTRGKLGAQLADRVNKT